LQRTDFLSKSKHQEKFAVLAVLAVLALHKAEQPGQYAQKLAFLCIQTWYKVSTRSKVSLSTRNIRKNGCFYTFVQKD
jgi:hypothetical protein